VTEFETKKKPKRIQIFNNMDDETTDETAEEESVSKDETKISTVPKRRTKKQTRRSRPLKVHQRPKWS
jgi:hypothetical protein